MMAQHWYEWFDMFGPSGSVIPNEFGSLNNTWTAFPDNLLSVNKAATNATSVILFPGFDESQVDIRFRFQAMRDGLQQFTNTGPGVVFRWDSTNDHLYSAARSYFSETTNWGGLYGLANNTQAHISSNTASGGKTELFNELRWARFRLTSSGEFLWSTWLEGDAEPSLASLGTFNLSAYPSSGGIGLRARQYPMIYKVDRVAIGTGGDVSPASMPGGPREISGSVRKPDGGAVGAGYKVFLHSQKNGIILAETVTNAVGEFLFSVNYTDEVYVVAVDNVGNTWKAPIADRITPMV